MMSDTPDLHTPPRFLVRIEVWDNEADEHIVDEAFNTSGLNGVREALNRAMFDVDTEIMRRSET